MQDDDEVCDRQHSCSQNTTKTGVDQTPFRGLKRPTVSDTLTHKALLLRVPQRGGAHAVGDQGEEGFFNLWSQKREQIKIRLRRGCGSGLLFNRPMSIHRAPRPRLTNINRSMREKGKRQDLQRRVKHHQFGAGGHDVVALVGFHKSHVNITLWFSSCEEEKSRKILSVGGVMDTKHRLNYGSGPLTDVLES